jgi:hypothetical protein
MTSLESAGLTFPLPLGDKIDSQNCNQDQGSRCTCCNLTPGEYGLLHQIHTHSVPTYAPPWTLQKFGFTSVLVRFSSKQHIEETLREHPVPDGVLVFILTSDKSASFRANLIRRFSGHDGQRAKLAVLRRAVQNGKAPEYFLKAISTGMGYILSEIEKFLARPRLLLADSTVDVGFDLHRHINGIHVPQMVSTHAELRQLTGRVSRIAVDRKDQGTIDVLTNCTDQSLDEVLFAKHLQDEEKIMSEAAPFLQVATSIRRKLQDAPDELDLFERLWLKAGMSLGSRVTSNATSRS